MTNLPGGVWLKGEVRRTFAFKPLCGHVELAVAEGLERSDIVPRRVTGALSAALEHIGRQDPAWDLVHGLSVGDRQFLVRKLAAHMGFDSIWLSASCGPCGALFDFLVRQSELPTKPASEVYPFTEVETSVGVCRLRVPTGADQEAVAGLEEGKESFRVLLRRLVVRPSGGEEQPEGFTEQDIAAIDAALEAVAPEVATKAQAACPECGRTNLIHVDPYVYLNLGSVALLAEIHRLASAYHWGEAEILALPTSRRRKYLQLVDRTRGMVQ